jgi:1-acyl-sn-glycerol-3-phosphate acyltransferase
MMGRMGGYLRITGSALLFAGAMVATTPLVLLGRAHAARILMARAMAATCRLMRLNVTITGSRHMLHTEPCVAVGNQQSLLCYVIYATLFRLVPDSAIVARLNGSWDLPLLTWFYRATGNFLVEPGNRTVTREGMEAARIALTRANRRVWIGPEGTRWKVPGELGPFKPGAFRLAIDAGVPIVPMVISPLLPHSNFSEARLDRNNVELRVLEPIPTQGLTRNDEPALMQECRARMQAALNEMARKRGVSVRAPMHSS